MDFNTTLNEFENCIWRDETPSDQMLDGMMAFYFSEGTQDSSFIEEMMEPSLNQIQSGTGKKRQAGDDVDRPPAKMPRYSDFGKRYQCSHCGRLFNRTDALKRHEKQVHEKRAAVREYKCVKCGEVFHNLAPFRAHQKTAHSQPSPRATKRSRDDKTDQKPKRMKPNPVEERKATSSWQEDPRTITDLPQDHYYYYYYYCQN